MAGVPQRQALEVLKERVELLEEKYDGYKADLIGALVEISNLEQENPYNISQRVSAEVTALAEKVTKQRRTTE